MSLEIQSDGQIQTFLLHGELDAMIVQQCRESAELALADEARLHIFDGRGISVIDSSGIGFVVYLYKKAKARGKQFALAGFAGQPLDMMRFLKLDQAIPCYQDQDDVREEYERRGQV